jgi:hypothetical protein
MIKPIFQDLIIYQNATFCFALTLTQASGTVDLTGATFKAQIRAGQNATSNLLMTFDSTADDGSITINIDTATVTLNSTKSANEALDFTKGFYDLLATWADGTTDKLANGAVIVSPGVTQ